LLGMRERHRDIQPQRLSDFIGDPVQFPRCIAVDAIALFQQLKPARLSVLGLDAVGRIPLPNFGFLCLEKITQGGLVGQQLFWAS
jgi:hypothetical protein